MTHIDAMKQGLEALELMYACYAHPEWISHKQQEEKILAQCVSTTMSLRQAIKDAEGQENALRALHAENERLGLYKDAYAEQEPVACDGDFPEGFDESLGIPAQALRQANAALCEVTNNRMWDVPALAERMLLFCRNTHPPQRTEQEPVIDKSAAVRIATALGWEPKREWVGLTDEDWVEIFGNSRTIGAAVRNTEAKLKQKNDYAKENI